MKVGLVGYGYWGENWARVLDERGVLAWVYDQDSSRRVQAKEDGYPTNYALEDCNSVVLATPAHTHKGLTEGLLRNGADVLVEKPAAFNPDFVRRSVERTRLRGLTYMVDHTFLYEEVFWRALQQAEEVCGGIRHIEARWENDGIVRDDVDVVWNVMPHPLSLINQIRPLEEASATLHENRLLTESALTDQATAHLAWEGMTAQINVSWASPVKQRTLFLQGPDGHAQIEFQNNYAYLGPNSGTGTNIHVNPEEPLALALEDFLAGIEDPDHEPVASVRNSGIPVVETLHRLTT